MKMNFENLIEKEIDEKRQGESLKLKENTKP